MVNNCSSCNHAEVCKLKEYRTKIQEELENIQLDSDDLHIVIDCDKYEEISITVGTGTFVSPTIKPVVTI